MVHVDQEHMAGFAELQNRDFQERRNAQVVDSIGVFPRVPPQFCLLIGATAKIQNRAQDRLKRVDSLTQFPVNLHERGAEDFIAPQQSIESLLQRAWIQCAFDLNAAGHIVCGGPPISARIQSRRWAGDAGSRSLPEL